MQSLVAECKRYIVAIAVGDYTTPTPGDMPLRQYVAARTLALPFFTRMTQRQIDHVCDTLEAVLEKTLTARKGRF
jgi:dTDP-4-amino-4,6-dideoxygalactose transaminase